jgi:hypothetical protein
VPFPSSRTRKRNCRFVIPDFYFDAARLRVLEGITHGLTCDPIDFVSSSRRCAWRIVISPMILQDFSSCYYSSMRNLAVLVIHLIATLARLLGPGGVRSLVAESLLLKHQLLSRNFLIDSFKRGLV